MIYKKKTEIYKIESLHFSALLFLFRLDLACPCRFIRTVYLLHQQRFLFVRQLLNSLKIRQILVAQHKGLVQSSPHLGQRSLTPQAERSGSSVIERILDDVVPVLQLPWLQAQRNSLVVEALLHGAALHQQPAQVPATGAQLLKARRLALEEVILDAALAADGLEDAQGEAGLDAGAKGGDEERLDVDVGAPEAASLVVVLGGDGVAEADAGAAVEAGVGLLVDEALAVGVGRDEVAGEAVRLDGFGGLGGCGGEGAGC